MYTISHYLIILYLVQERTANAVWIGGTDQANEGNWTWADCTTWNFTRWGNRSGYVQPDNSKYQDGDGENCLLFHGKNATNVDWNDVACNLKEREFICSKPICPPGKACSGCSLF